MSNIDNLCYPYFGFSDQKINPIQIVSASGSKIKTIEGNELIDGVSSWWSVCHGYSHLHILNNMQKQMQRFSHVMFGGITHEPAQMLANMLCEFFDGAFQKVFFSDSGSTAVEVSLKMAIQHWVNQGFESKKIFVYFENGYHGDTCGAMSVSDAMQNGMFDSIVQKHLRTKVPETEEDFLKFEELILLNRQQVAAAIIEPLFQGAGGCKMYPRETLNRIFRILKKYNILIISDECATGFYRTGMKFASVNQNIDIKPDIMILGKALTAGYIGLAATCITQEIFESVYKTKFCHGPTFMANPLACSAAIASLELFALHDYSKMVQNINLRFLNLANKIGGRALGAIFAIDFEGDSRMNYTIKAEVASQKHGIWLRPLGNTLYMMPPLNISDDELDFLINRFVELVNLAKK